jgi:hypothetical protein
MDARGDSTQTLTRASTAWHVAWAVVFLANLIAPLLLAWSMTEGEARFGMFAAVALVWVSGHLAIARAAGWRLILVGGGFCVALSQLFPILQVFAGLLSLTAIHYGFATDPFSFTAPAAFLATVLTAAQLLVTAVGCGVVVEAGCRPREYQAERGDF